MVVMDNHYTVTHNILTLHKVPTGKKEFGFGNNLGWRLRTQRFQLITLFIEKWNYITSEIWFFRVPEYIINL